MFYIPMILGSTRRGRQSAKVARFIYEHMRRYEQIETEILDLLECNFPIMEERLRFHDDPPPRLREFSEKIARADAVVIVTPEYNNGYPGVLKNSLDYLLAMIPILQQWRVFYKLTRMTLELRKRYAVLATRYASYKRVPLKGDCYAKPAVRRCLV
jgi:FMN-dependent NADH-azoreductase